MSFFTNAELAQKAAIKINVDQLEAKCMECGLHKKCRTPKMEYSGEGKKKILIIGEFPSTTDDQYGVHFAGDSGKVLSEFLLKEGISLNKDCWKINAVNCSPGRLPTKKEIKCCRPYVEKAIKKLKPELIILLGDIAIESLYGECFSNRSVHRWRAYRIPDQEYECFVFPMFHPSMLTRRKYDKNLHSVFKRDIKRAVNTLSNVEFRVQKDYEKYVTVLTDFLKVKRLLKRIIQRKAKIMFDYETTGLKPYRTGHKIVTIGLAVSPTKAFAFPFDYKSFWTEKEFKELKQLWKQILLDPKIKKMAHNHKFEDSWSLVCVGARPKGWYWDSMIAEKVIDNRSSATNLKFQTFVKFGIRPYDKFIKPFLESNKGDFNNVEQAPFKDLLIYNGLDCIYAWMLYEQEKRRFSGMKGLSRAYGFLMRGLHTMGTIQANGITVDMRYYKQVKKDLTKRINKLEKYLTDGREARKFKDKYKRTINLASNPDLGKLFYEVLGKEPIYTNEKKINYKTDRATLETLNLSFVDKFLEMKKLEKARGTYLSQFARESFKGKMHPFFDLHIPKTYRSCIAGYEKVLVMRDPESIPIKDIRVGDYVYCFDDNLNPQIKKVLWQGKTGHREIIRVHYYRKGKKGHFDCTPEHKVRLINGEYVEAQNLLKAQHYKRTSHQQSKCRVLACSCYYDRLSFTGHHIVNYRPNKGCGFLLHRRALQHSFSTGLKSGGSRPIMFQDIYNDCESQAHIITEVEWLGRTEDVYDIEVEDCHNFFVNEICVHNSSSRPNFQNIPKRDPETGNLIRKGIIPESDSVLCELDFSGAEVNTSVCYHRDKNFYNYLIDSSTDMHRDCYDMETKILTKSGFKFYHEIKNNEKIGQYNPDTDKIEFVVPTNRIYHDYTGDMYYIKNRHVDTATTANHRMYLRKKNTEYSIIKAKDIKRVRYYSKVTSDVDCTVKIPKFPEFHFPSVYGTGVNSTKKYHNKFFVKTDDMFELLGYLITDGHFRYHKQGAYRISLSQIKNPHRSKMKQCIDRIKSYTDFNFYEEKDKWSMSNKNFCLWLCDNFGINKINRKLPDFIKYAPIKQLKLFFDACMLGDGSWYPSKTSGKFYLVSKQLLDDFQFICMRLGYATSVYLQKLKGNRKIQVYTINIRKMRESFLDMKDHLVIKKYTGKVFCFTVPSGLLVTQRNNKISIQGNCASDIWLLPPDMLNNPSYTDEQKKKAKMIRFYAKNCWTFAQFYGDWFKSCGENLWNTCIEGNLELPTGVPLRDHLANQGIYELGTMTKYGPEEGTFLDHCARVEDKMWNERFPEYTQWKKDIVKFYRKYGYIETFFGFRFVGYMDEKQCCNYPIQSTSFHLLLYTLILVEKFILKHKLRAKLIGQIHDSIVMNIHKDEIKFVVNGVNKIVKSLKDRFKWLIVPMEIEVELSELREDGGNFAEMKEYSIEQINQLY